MRARAAVTRSLAIGCSLVAVAWLARSLGWKATRHAFSQASWPLLLTGVGFTALAYVVAVVRWQTLLSTKLHLPATKLLRLLLVGHLANVLLPLRAGDLLRPLLVRRATGGNFGLAVTSIVVERLLDVLAVVIIGASVLPSIEAPQAIRAGLWAFSWVCLVGCLAAVFLAWQSAHGSALRLWTERSRWLARLKLAQALGHLFEALSLLRNARTLVVAVALSLLQWGLSGAGVIACVTAFGLGPWTAGIFLMVASNLGSAIPSLPAAVGVYHAVGVLALKPWGLLVEPALAITIAAHLSTLVLQVGGGVVAAWYEGGALALFGQAKAAPEIQAPDGPDSTSAPP